MAWNKNKAAGGAASGAATGTAIMPGWGTAIGAVAGGLLGGMYGGDDGEAERQAQKELMMQTLAEIQGISVPELKQIALENPRWLEDLQAQQLEPSQMKYVTTDPRLRSQQNAALDALNQISESGGLTLQDRANLSDIQNQVATADKGRRDALLQNMNARGMGGSGLELLANLQSSQAATDRGMQSGLNVAGMAQNRALDAIMQSGNLAGNIRGQDFSEQSKKAEAADAIARFNAQNRQDVNRYNIGGRQDMANQGVTIRNQNQMMPNQIAQQNYENQMNKANAMGTARGLEMSRLGQNRAEDIQADANKWAGIGKVATSFGNYYQNKQNQNQNQNPQNRKRNDDEDQWGNY